MTTCGPARWRLEDLPWEVTCVNRITGESRDVPYGEFNEDRGYCNQPEEYKVIFKYIAVSVSSWLGPNTASEVPHVRE